MDDSNPTQADIDRLNEIKNSTNNDFTISLFPSYDHDLIDTNTGSLGIQVIPTISNWLNDKITQ